ncbi:S-layer homology domain-containing protein [Bacillus sp. SCS-151]|uniref:S-layer homology domain-containing protein n=1 Tax=Nanhaiella sioensis TaxID=3115293 RepID=UPI003979ABF9
MQKFKIFTLTITLLISVLLSGMTVRASTSFSDVSDDFWAKNEIEFLSGENIIKGFSDGTFKPNDEVKRVQAAIMIVRALGLDTSNRPNPGISDINFLDQEAFKAIATVVDEGIFAKEDYFYPYSALTRGEMAVALVNAYKLEGTYEGEITDVSNELFPYVSLLASNGITQIYDDNTYKPDNTVKRAHFAVFFSRVLDDSFKVKNEEETTESEDELTTQNIDLVSVDLEKEIVTISNAGNEDVDMTGWTLVSVEGNQTFEFPSGYVLNVGSTVYITSGKNAQESSPTYLKWTGANIWNNGGDVAELYNADGELVDEL